jgi:hypothetical protein|eukprot:COSAG02_NODE_328_length_24547_cov_4.124141_8_plen_95_part_00
MDMDGDGSDSTAAIIASLEASLAASAAPVQEHAEEFSEQYEAFLNSLAPAESLHQEAEALAPADQVDQQTMPPRRSPFCLAAAAHRPWCVGTHR